MFDRWLKVKTPSSSRQEPAGDRRQHVRLDRYFDCTFTDAWGIAEVRVNSLSSNGCFIHSRSAVPSTGAILENITISLPAGPITVQGEVVNPTRGVGFGVRFISVDAEAQKALAALSSP